MCGLLFAAAFLCLPHSGYAAHRCYSMAQAPHHLHHKACIKAHVYREVNLDDGTRILDLCRPQSQGGCDFALVSLDHDRKAVGDLQQYVGQDIEVLGTIQPIRGRAEILLRKSGQLQNVNQPEEAEARESRTDRAKKDDRFHGNPELLKSFNAEQTRMPVNDPAFRASTNNSY